MYICSWKYWNLIKFCEEIYTGLYIFKGIYICIFVFKHPYIIKFIILTFFYFFFVFLFYFSIFIILFFYYFLIKNYLTNLISIWNWSEKYYNREIFTKKNLFLHLNTFVLNKYVLTCICIQIIKISFKKLVTPSTRSLNRAFSSIVGLFIICLIIYIC